MRRRRRMRVLFECYECGGLSRKVGVAFDRQGRDFLRCLVCGAVEPGFEEITDEEVISRFEEEEE